jgi:triosephosphate isomerase
MIKRTLPLIVGNWKATPETKEDAIKIIKALEKKISSAKIKLPKKSYYIAVPEIFIPYITTLAKHGYIGSETVHGVANGQTTGGSTPVQLLSGGAVFTLVGHSEVRAHGETKESRIQKIQSALSIKFPVIFCVGEHKRDKEGKYLEELESDIKETLSDVPREFFQNLVIAYEPVWAIGAGNPATTSECFEAVIAIRRALASLAGIDYAKKVHILYGGTVTKDTAQGFLKEGGVDGLLIGRASQDAATFFDIISSTHTK